MTSMTTATVSERCSRVAASPRGWVKRNRAGTTSPTAANARSATFMPAAWRLKVCVWYLRPPASSERPRISSRLPMIEPVREALTSSISPALRAKIPMISSAALPSVAFIRPPKVGPVRAASSSVAIPIRCASGTIAAAVTRNTRAAGACVNSRTTAAGTRESGRYLSQRVTMAAPSECPVPPARRRRTGRGAIIWRVSRRRRRREGPSG